MLVKPGYKTTELAATVAAAVGALLASWDGVLPPRYAAIAATASAAAYALSRGLTKLGAYLGAGRAAQGGAALAPVEQAKPAAGP